MGLVLKRRGQISLEFMLVFAIMLVMLLYSIRATTFNESSPSVGTLGVEVAIEEKHLANAISNTISQVYAQGPGSKATSYVRLVYLRNGKYLEKALSVKNPRVFLTYGHLPGASENGTYVMVVNGTGVTTLFLNGGEKNVFVSPSMFQGDFVFNTSVWNPDSSYTFSIGGNTKSLHGIALSPSSLPSYLKIVVEWNPDRPNSWTYSQGELMININPGE